MNFQTFKPHPDLDSLIKHHWTLEVPADVNANRQRIVPDGNIDLIFILGDDVKRYTAEDEFIIQPRAMVLGQTTEPFYIEPTGYVESFAVCFYPYGFAHFVSSPIKNLVNKETPIQILFGEVPAKKLEKDIINTKSTQKRIQIVEDFLLQKLKNEVIIDDIVKSTIDTIFLTKGSTTINSLLKNDLSKRRQLERKFLKQVGLSPKQLSKVIRLQAALKLLLNGSDKLTDIAYESGYYDQSHFIKDFKEFTGISPNEFSEDDKMDLSSLLYSKE